MKIIIHTIPAFHDNYFWLFHQKNSQSAAIVDPGDSNPVLALLNKHKLELTDILVTHQHPDHIGGVEDLLQQYPNCRVYGPKDISLVTHPVVEGNCLVINGITFSVISVPGHTLNHIAYYTDQDCPRLFCGDTLFAAGCGRLFEGTAEQMLNSLRKLAALPDTTKVYCAHEYTEANLRFAQAVEPSNHALTNRASQVRQMRAEGLATVPTTIDIEKQTNPFLRTSQLSIHQAAEAYANCHIESEPEVFATIRRWKDSF